MRIVFMGTPDFAVHVLSCLAGSGHTLAGVVTAQDKPRGRKGTPVPSDVGAAAEKMGLPLLKCAKVRAPEVLAWLREREPDVIVVAAFGQLIPKSILTLPEYGCVNVHASLLPAYRGAAPVQHAVLDGCKESGVTIMQMNEGLDTGDILSQVTVPLAEDETAGSLFDKLAELSGPLLLETLEALEEGRVTPVPQPAESTTPYAAMLTKEMGLIDPSDPVDKVEAQIRGMDPWPGAYIFFGGKRFRIRKAVKTERRAEAPGTLRAENGALYLSLGDGVLSLLAVQPEGKKSMEAADYLNGHPFEVMKADPLR